MEISEKLIVLARGARYDVSCSSSGSNRLQNNTGFGSTSYNGICHSWTEDGRCVSLLKILFSNICIYDCFYCINGTSNDIPRTSFTPDEVAKLTAEFYRRNYIEGLFLSSAITYSEDYTMEQLVITVKKLRNDYKFQGYIHLKGIPGASRELLTQAGKLVDRLSINIELPSQASLEKLAPDKDGKQIITAMKTVGKGIKEYKQDQKKSQLKNNKKAFPSPFVPAGQSTQLIVGASQDSDLDILRLSENLYQKIGLRRVFYSAFIPISTNHNNKLPAINQPPFRREHRLYQADWLLRFYKFTSSELFNDKNFNLKLEIDPKAQFALTNFHLFPKEINTAPKNDLLKIPGIGPKSAHRILKVRRHFQLTYQDLKNIGVVLKRARYFITCKGKYYGGVPFKREVIEHRLLSSPNYKQLSLWGDN